MFLYLRGEENFFYIIIKFFYKSKNFFSINMGIHTVIIYFGLCLLINGYKNIYSHNDYL